MQLFTGYEYILIDIANQFGMDKFNWMARLQWTNDNITILETLEDIADDPILFMKGVRALRSVERGEATGFIMGLDATASGIQIMACLQGCVKTANAVNLIDHSQRKDVYQDVANIMSKATGEKITKDIVKKPVMTTFYGSKNQPQEVFGEKTPELRLFYETLEEMLPGAMECMNDMQGCWLPNALEHKWTLPDGHIAKVKVMNSVDKKIEVDELNHATYTHRAYVNTPSEKGLSLPANIVHSVDGYLVREMVRRADIQGFELLSIHDSFWASPNYMDQVRINYIDILTEIADSNLLEDILNEITGQSLKLKKFSTTLPKQMRSANYALS